MIYFNKSVKDNLRVCKAPTRNPTSISQTRPAKSIIARTTLTHLKTHRTAERMKYSHRKNLRVAREDIRAPPTIKKKPMKRNNMNQLMKKMILLLRSRKFKHQQQRCRKLMSSPVRMICLLFHCANVERKLQDRMMMMITKIKV